MRRGQLAAAASRRPRRPCVLRTGLDEPPSASWIRSPSAPRCSSSTPRSTRCSRVVVRLLARRRRRRARGPVLPLRASPGASRTPRRSSWRRSRHAMRARRLAARCERAPHGRAARRCPLLSARGTLPRLRVAPVRLPHLLLRPRRGPCGAREARRATRSNALGRRIADLSATFAPRDPGPRPLSRIGPLRRPRLRYGYYRAALRAASAPSPARSRTRRSIGAVYVPRSRGVGRASPTVDERAGGASARQIEAFVHGRFGAEITRAASPSSRRRSCSARSSGARRGASSPLRDALRRAAPPERSVARETSRPSRPDRGAPGARASLRGMAHEPQLYADALVRARRAAAHGAGARHRRARAREASVLLGLFGARALPRRPAVAVARLAAAHRARAPPGASRRLGADPRGRRARGARSSSSVPLRERGARRRAERPPQRPRPRRRLAARRPPRRRAPRRTCPRSPRAARASTARTSRSRARSPRGSRSSPAATRTTTASARCSRAGRSARSDFDALPARLARAGYATGVVERLRGRHLLADRPRLRAHVDVPEFDFRQLVRQRALERRDPAHARAALAPRARRLPGDARDERRRRARDARRRRGARDAPRAGRAVRSSSSSSSPRRTSPTPRRPRTTGASPIPPTAGASSTTSRSASARERPPTPRTASRCAASTTARSRAIDDARAAHPRRAPRRAARRRTRSWSSPPTTARRSTTTGHGAGHGDHLFGDEGTHVPARRRRSAQARRAARRRAIVRDVDLAPTLYALTGVEPAEDLDGQLARPRARRPAARPARSRTPRPASGSPRTSPASRRRCACRTRGSRA